MTPDILIAIIAFAGVIGAALITAVGVVLGLVWRRLVTAEATNNSLWLYTRVLIDAYYHEAHRAPPGPPDYIAHLYKMGQPT